MPSGLHPPMPPSADAGHRPLRFIGQLIDTDPYTLPSYSIPQPNSMHARHRLRSRHRDLLAPDFDVRETDSAYFLEGEFPGIADREAIKLEWVDNRTLAIDAKIGRVDLEREWGLGGNKCEGGCSRGRGCGPCGVPVTLPTPPQQTSTLPPIYPRRSSQGRDGDTAMGNGADDAESAESVPAMEPPQPFKQERVSPPATPQFREWLSERRVGHYQRTFTFPADVDAMAVKARLGQGLLRILVPKVRQVDVKAREIVVENCE